MATIQEFSDQFALINEATTNIAADIQRLADSLASGLTAEQEETALTELRGIATRLAEIAAVTPE